MESIKRNTDEIIIGYQGIKFCNNYFAVNAMAENMKKNMPNKEIKIIPLEKSKNVVNALLKGEIDYGSMAFKTDLVEHVQETKDACENISYEIIDEYISDIHHCLFKKNKNIPNDLISKVCSHVEAIRECTIKIKELFPNAINTPYETTGVAARDLANGKLPDDTAVVCSKEAGEKYGLTLVMANAENIKPNNTYFYMIRLKNKY